MSIMINWNEIETKLDGTLDTIFYDYDINDLSFYEKRKVIFEYLTNNLEYDYDLLEKIRDFNVNGVRVVRDPAGELNSVINSKKGICNAISQYYKLLLEKVGVKSYCVICDDGTDVKHQLNLVYDSDNDSYSFDDVTSVVVKRGIASDYFDYDLEFASSINQGGKVVMGNRNYVILPEDYVNYLVGRKSSFTDTLVDLPNNIVSIKSKVKSK